MNNQRAFEKNYARAVEAFQSGKLQRADKLLKDLTRTFGLNPWIVHLTGFVQLKLGNHKQASRTLRDALQHFPKDANIHNALGVIDNAAGHKETAEASFRKALALDPHNVEANRNLADVLTATGRETDALGHLDLLLRLTPDDESVPIAISKILEGVGETDRAEALLNAYLERSPKAPDVLSRLGEIAHENHRYQDAEALYKRALAIKEDPVTAAALGGLEVLAGNVAEGLARQRKYAARAEMTAQAASAYVQNLNYDPDMTAEGLRKGAESWARKHGVSAPPLIARTGMSTLRVGLVTQRVKPHPVRSFVMPWAVHRDTERVELHLFTTEKKTLPADDPFRQCFTSYNDISALDLDGAVQHIRDRAMDIAITPTGHEEGNLLRLFAAPLAPVQVAAFAIFGTTGLSQVTALIGDTYHLPQDADAGYSEELVRMPDDYVCYEPPAYLPDLASSSDAQSRAPTFGSFNNLAKSCDRTLALWAKVLARVDGAKLVMRGVSLADPDVAAFTIQRMEKAGIDPDAVVFKGPLPHAELLAAYSEMDVALDSLSYSGGVTTLEALWMGVPVITLPGNTFARRHSYSHLMNAGLGDCVAANEDDYVRRAVDTMSAVRSGNVTRQDIRTAIADSPISDSARYASNMDRVLMELAG